jgi:hypothetical protein
MPHISRRVFVGAIALSPVSSTTAPAATDPAKKEFVNKVVANLHHRQQVREQKKKDGWRYYSFDRICVPVPFADQDFYYTDSDLIYVVDKTSRETVRVPRYFCTDLTSVPRIFWSILPKHDRYLYAAIMHDYLYWTQTTTRKKADDLLFAAMVDSGVGSWKRWSIYSGVRTGGVSSWDSNKRARGAGEKRFLKVIPPRDRLISWEEWRKNPAHFQNA